MASSNSDACLERPKRLLHIPSMTSMTWESVVSRLERPPPYNALSYTWGRFTSEEDPPLDVRGISWRVPGIRPSHFTASEFCDILTTIAPESGYVWVDIACIDQEYLPMKMEEIGKQADIFRGAERAFIWLTAHTDESLSVTSRTLYEFGELLASIEVDASNLSYNKSELQYMLDDRLGNALSAAEELFKDPWFSSLWTLQEAYLRPDATLLSKDGKSILTPAGKRILNLDLLSAYVQQIYVSLPPPESSRSSLSPIAQQQALLTCLHRSGLMGIDTLDVPVHIYPAAHARTCENDVDRVYAIMQVYRLRLGASRHPHRVYTINQLEDELVQALNGISPLAAQLFLHDRPPSAGRAWMITRVCVLPPTYFLVGSVRNLCTIYASSQKNQLEQRHQQQIAVYKGRECSLDEMTACWVASIRQRTHEYLHHTNPNYRFYHYSADIDLDAGHVDQVSRPMFFRLMEERLSTCACGFCQRVDRNSEGPSLGVARLKEILPYPMAQYRLLEIANFFTSVSLGGGYSVHCSMAILGLFENDGDRRFFRRVGICCWEKAQGELVSVYDSVWTATECFLA
ncbi:heterokaryon incompatibility protein-domain-containing protein [Aspergillus insuetus]